MNQIILIGRLTREPELRYIAGSGTPVAQFAIAVDREFTGKDGKKETDFIDIQVWGKSAENCANYIVKGSLVGIQGSLRIDKYLDKDGESKTKSKIYATNFHFLGHKHPENDTYKLFDNKTLFNEVINKESQNEEISEEQIPF